MNLYGEDWDDARQDDPPGWKAKWVRVGRRLGAERLGGTVYELERGNAICPYHFHFEEEEMLIVLRGEATLRTPEGERRLSTGDCVLFKRGPEGAHLVRNDTEQPVRVLMLSASSDVEVCVYPDSDKIGAFAPDLRFLAPRSAEVDYFEGEE
ncbi:MAG: cupin domain-containing protein [Gaiellaceae bacterium]